MGFEPCNCILGETKTGICTRLLCCSRTDPSSLARELQLFCWKAQKLSYIESKLSLLTNCKQQIGGTQSFTLTLCIFQTRAILHMFSLCARQMNLAQIRPSEGNLQNQRFCKQENLFSELHQRFYQTRGKILQNQIQRSSQKSRTGQNCSVAAPFLSTYLCA